MPEALLWLPILVAVAGGAAALRAVVDGLPAGIPASVALLAPLSEAARALRTRPRLVRRAAIERAAGVLLVLVAALRVLLLPIAGAVAIDPLPGVALLVALDVLAWASWWAIAAERVHALAYLARAAAIEAAVVVALAGPVVAAGSLRLPAVVAAQRDALPFAVQMPAVLLVLLAATLLSPWSAPGGAAVRAHLAGPDRLLPEAARALALAAACATAATLLLGPAGAGGRLLATAVLAGALVLVGRRLPVLRLERAARAALLVLLPLALVQLAVVGAIAALAAG